ncbi:MAG: phage tail protein [Eggerthellaceae bacterium]|nr:phage tail protein [Eggerthellaceae bacterium]
MWTITLDGNALHVPGTGAAVVTPKLTQQANSADALQFTIAIDHPLYQACIDGVLTGRYIVEKDGAEMSRGRILSRTINPFDSTADVVCEGELAYLNDSVLSQYEFSGAPKDLLSKMLKEHNAQCDRANAIKLGSVTVVDPNNYIVRGSEKPVNLMSELLSKTANSSTGGWLSLRHVGNDTYLDWLDTPAASGNQSIAKGSNLLDISDELDGATLITAIMPIGAKSGTDYVRLPTGSDGRVSGDVYRKGQFLYNKKLVDRYGWHADVQEWDDVTTSANLRTRGVNIVKSLAFESAISISALDLSDAGYDVDSFMVGQRVGVTCDSIEGDMLITGITWDLDDPSASSFAFGASKTLTQAQSSTSSDTDGGGWSNADTSQYVWHRHVDSSGAFGDTESTIVASVPETDADELGVSYNWGMEEFYEGVPIVRSMRKNGLNGSQWPGCRFASYYSWLGSNNTDIYICGGLLRIIDGAISITGERYDRRRRSGNSTIDPAHDNDYIRIKWEKGSTAHSILLDKDGIHLDGTVTVNGTPI